MSDTEPIPPASEPDDPYRFDRAAPLRPARHAVRSRAVAVVVLVALGATAGVGIGHAAWKPASSRSAAASGATAAPGMRSANGFEGLGGLPTVPGGVPGFGDQTVPGVGSGGSSGSNGSSTSDGPTDAASIARDVDPGVVDITTTVAGGEAAGTGMVLTSDGEVLTNNHVIDGATGISVRDVGNGKTYKATVVGYDRTEDVAVLQLDDASDLSTVTPATSEPVSGASVVGIGNAGGPGGTPSYAGGSITGTDRSITASDAYDGTSERLTGLLATDADIQSGDSGGPLVNASGEVVGMDTAASSSYSLSPFGGDSDSSRGFAIPILTALRIANAIESGDASSTVHLGSTAKLGVYIATSNSGTAGAVVDKIQRGGPAARAGLVAGDIITSIDGTGVRSANAMSNVMTELAPGQTVTVTEISRDGEQKLRVTLGKGAPQ